MVQKIFHNVPFTFKGEENKSQTNDSELFP